MPKYKKKSFGFYFLCAFALLIIDQVSKYIIRSSGGFYICNQNLAFGIKPQLAILFLLILTSIFFINIGSKIFTSKIKSNLLDKSRKYKFRILEIYYLPIILIFTGGISNIIDRIFFGCVIDFIDLNFWPVFNLADVFVVMGAIIILIQTIKQNSYVK